MTFLADIETLCVCCFSTAGASRVITLPSYCRRSVSSARIRRGSCAVRLIPDGGFIPFTDLGWMHRYLGTQIDAFLDTTEVEKYSVI